MIGKMPTEMFTFFKSFCDGAKANLQISKQRVKMNTIK